MTDTAPPAMNQPAARAVGPAPTARTAAAPPAGEPPPIAEVAAARLAAATMSRSVRALLAETFAAVETPVATAIGRIYLESVAVTDYRGIGERTWFRLAPRPGVTLVVGRNGAGKWRRWSVADVVLHLARTEESVARTGAWPTSIGMLMRSVLMDIGRR